MQYIVLVLKRMSTIQIYEDHKLSINQAANIYIACDAPPYNLEAVLSHHLAIAIEGNKHPMNFWLHQQGESTEYIWIGITFKCQTLHSSEAKTGIPYFLQINVLRFVV